MHNDRDYNKTPSFATASPALIKEVLNRGEQQIKAIREKLDSRQLFSQEDDFKNKMGRLLDTISSCIRNTSSYSSSKDMIPEKDPNCSKLKKLQEQLLSEARIYSAMERTITMRSGVEELKSSDPVQNMVQQDDDHAQDNSNTSNKP